MEVLVLEDQVGLVRCDGVVAFTTDFSLLLGEALNTVWLVLFVAVDALTDKLLGTQCASQTVVVILTILESDNGFQDGLGTLSASGCCGHLVLFVTIFAQSLAYKEEKIDHIENEYKHYKLYENNKTGLKNLVKQQKN